MRNYIKNAQLKLSQVSRRTWLVIGLTTLVVVVGGYLLAFRDREVVYNYDGNSCVPRPTLLPDLMRSSGDDYRLSTSGGLAIGSLHVVSTKICVVALRAPAENQTTQAKLSLFGTPLLSTRFDIKAPSYPVVDLSLDKPVATSKPLELALSETDKTFDYKLSANDKTVDCQAAKRAIRCDLRALGVAQGADHQISVARYFKGQATSKPVTGNVRTVTALTVGESSIQADQMVYDKPKEITVKLSKLVNKSSVEVQLSRQDGDKAKIDAKAEAEGDVVRIILGTELERQATYSLDLSADATDGSTFDQPYSLVFKTSGGPKVSATNIGSGYIPGSPVSLTFDQPLDAASDLTRLIELKGLAGSITLAGSTVTIKPQAIDRCGEFSVVVKPGLVSEHGVQSDATSTHQGRARCYSTETIGYSVNGQPIVAYYFGNGASHVLYTGAIHGNELSTKYTMQSWIDELDAKAGDIPASKTLVVVPVANPDGAATGRRDNVRGVNLNRNFPTANWESDIVTGGGRQNGGGGSGAGSEPETKALMSLTRRINPSFVVTFHSIGSLVNSNDAGNSIAVGRQYASMTGYWFIPNSATTGTFGFDMTGTYEDWLLERGTPAILIELGTHYSSHFSGQRAALWMTAK